MTGNIFGSFSEDMQYVTAIAYDVSNNAIYLGHATPGTLKSEAKWRIKKMTYDVSNNCTDVQFASGDSKFDKVWNDRATAYTYS